MEAIEISDDALKLMVAENGVRGTARMLGLDQRQTDAFRQRVTRGRWLADPAIVAIRERNGTPVRTGCTAAQPVVAKVSPQAAYAAELRALGEKTRLGLAKGMASASAVIAEMEGERIISNAADIKAVASTADLVHGWKDAAPQVKIRLDVLGSTGEPAQIVDVEADVSPSDAWDSDELDNY